MGLGQKCMAYAIMLYSWAFLFAFWGALIAGYFYYGFIGEGDWDCYATQDGEILTPWMSNEGDDVPDEYHHVNANLQVVCIWVFF